MRKFELNLPPGDSQNEFLIYLNSELGKVQEAANGTATFKPDGSFIAYSTSYIRIRDEKLWLKFEIHSAADRTLNFITVDSVETVTVDWGSFVNDLIMDALAKALSKKKEEFFHRMRFSYHGANLEGEYWISNFRIAPAVPDDPEPYMMNAERVLYLDFHSHAVDLHHAFFLAQEFATLQASRMSLILDTFLYQPTYDQIWVMPNPSPENPNPASTRMNAFFNPEISLPNKMPAKGEICPLGNVNGSISDRFRFGGSALVTFPQETRRIYRLINSNVIFQQTFDACARMYQLGLAIRKYSATASLAYRVAAIDAICTYVADIKGPSEFMKKYVPEDADQEVLNYLYGNVRSGHFHAGDNPLDRRTSIPFHPFFTSDYVTQSRISDHGFWLTRKAIVSWILEEIKVLDS